MTSTIDTRVDSEREAGTPALVTSDGAALSWEDVFDEYAPALTAFARSRGVREPEDLVQNVFVAAVEQLPGFVGDRSNLRSLLFTIAFRRIADEHRLLNRRREELVAEHASRPDPGLTIEQIVDLGESARVAVQAMSMLSDRERRVIEMRILEETSPSKVGKALGLSSGHIRVIQARALAKVRAHLTSLGEGGFPQVVVTGGTLTDFVRCLRTELPADDVLRPWIDQLRSISSSRLDAPVLANRATMAAGTAAATQGVTEAAFSLISTVISSGAARIGAVVSVVALSTLPVAPAVVGGAESSSPFDEPSPVVEVQVTVPTPLMALADETSQDSIDVTVDHPVIDNPDPPSVAIEGSQPSDPTTEVVAREGDGRPVGDSDDQQRVTTPELIDDVLVPVVEDTVEPLVDEVVEVVEDTVEPLVGEVVEVVEVTVEPLVGEVVEVAEDTVEPLVGEVVESLVDDVTDTLDAVVPGLGGLLAGR